MSERIWFDDPRHLIRSDKLLSFWPSKTQSVSERVNATSRFVIYSGILLYLIKKDTRIPIIVIVTLCILFIMYRGKIIKKYSGDDYVQSCQTPSKENPMGNVLLSDYTDKPNRLGACMYDDVQDDVQKYVDSTFPVSNTRSHSALPEYQRRAAARQFISAPVTSIPGDQTSFAEWCYGKKNRPLCRDDPSMCDPNARGAQLEMFAGLDPSGQGRGLPNSSSRMTST